MEEGCDAMMARKQVTFFKGIVMITSEISLILHVASGGCVTKKNFMVIAYVEDIGILI